ncbi:MAG: metalloregulator ArsR/SmtB family transcription factor [Pseudomonadota bacterium]
MVERYDVLTQTLKAAADPNRREILTLLAQEGPLRVTDLAARFPISLNAVSKHIKSLEAAGLVTRRTDWREHLIELNTEPVAEIDRWFSELRSIWALRLERLSDVLTQEDIMTDTDQDLRLTVSKYIAAPPERVFDAWLDPKLLASFMVPGPNVTVAIAEADPKVGGRFRIVMQASGNDMPHTGTYKEIRRPDRLVFTWESPFSTIENSTVTLEFAKSAGGTSVTLTHVRFENETMRADHEKGWSTILSVLAAEL